MHVNPEILAQVIETIHQHLPNASLIAFGSRVTGQPKATSDLDIAIKGQEKIELKTLAQITEALANTDITYKIDIVDYNRITPGFQKHIDLQGKKIIY